MVTSATVLLLFTIGVEGFKLTDQAFFIPEDTPVYSVIGNIFTSNPGLDDIRHDPGLVCSVLKHGNPYGSHFEITKSSGDIFLLKNLDREKMCDLLPECTIKLGIALTWSSRRVKFVRVVIIVSDVNDNAPSFRKPNVTLEIPEDSEVNTTFPISSATDLDRGDNSHITYSLVNSSDMFSLETAVNLDGTEGVNIVLNGKLDAETQKYYKMIVLAKDGGSPQKTGSASVTVMVASVNRPPVFTPEHRTVDVEENSNVISPVITVTASDNDTGVNGQLSYKLSSETMIKYSDMFAIDAVTGAIIAMKWFDFEEQMSYRLVVEAIDGGSPAKTSSTVVKINVIDVNDNAPDVKVNFLFGENQAYISEVSEVKHFVAAISVTDADSGVNAAVSCYTDHHHFRLIPIGKTEFHLVSKAMLDRERESKHSVLITCQDGGNKPNVVSTEVIVNVVDENDNAPRFVDRDPKIFITKKAKVGEVICHLTAVDDDENENARVSYEIVPPNQYFAVDENSGAVSISQPVEKLRQPEVTLIIVARDQGIPPKQDRTKVVIYLTSSSPVSSLQHENDNFSVDPKNISLFPINGIIVTTVVSLTFIVSAILVIVICCVKRINSKETYTENPQIMTDKEANISIISTEKLTIDIDI